MVGALAHVRIRPRTPLRGRSGHVRVGSAPGPLAAGAPTVAIAAGGFTAGLGFGVFGPLWDTTMQKELPPEVLSRASAYDWFGSLVFLPIGFSIVGGVPEVLRVDHHPGGGGVLGRAEHGRRPGRSRRAPAAVVVGPTRGPTARRAALEPSGAPVALEPAPPATWASGDTAASARRPSRATLLGTVGAMEPDTDVQAPVAVADPTSHRRQRRHLAGQGRIKARCWAKSSSAAWVRAATRARARSSRCWPGWRGGPRKPWSPP